MSTLWRPLSDDECFHYNYPTNPAENCRRGYAVQVEVRLSGHLYCNCYWSSHAKTVTLFREEQHSDGVFPVHCSVSDRWFHDIQHGCLMEGNSNGMRLSTSNSCGISYGCLRKRAPSQATNRILDNGLFCSVVVID